jgi:hypothetical protein
MSILPIISFLIHLTVSSWLLTVVLRRGIWRQLPWFTGYVASEVVGASVGLVLWFVDRQLYVAVSWSLDVAQIILIVGTVRESFLRTFVGFSSLRWFPWLVWSVIGSIVVYSAWKAIYAPPVQNNRIVALIIDGEFTFRWAIVAVGLLSAGLERLFTLARDTREVAVIEGCAVASVGVLAWAVIRSLFGTRFALITQYFGELAYLIAAWIWLKYMLRREAEIGFKQLGVTPDQVALELRRYREAAERLLRKREGV